jgi:hypothetical protein
MNKTPNGSYKGVANSQEAANLEAKITCDSALRAEGVDEVFVARKLKDLLRAQGRRWNPKKGSWERFEDYGTQLAALREIAKIFDIYPKDSEDADRPVRIDISAIPFHRERARNDEHSIGAAAGDGRERRERFRT